MININVKLLSFYSISIAFVLVLFKVVTAYGETNLKAAPVIAGSYRFDAKSLPECLKSDSLVLTIEQSGVYLRGSLRSGIGEGEGEKTEEKPPLAGKWENQGLSLSGVVPNLPNCSGSPVTGKNSFVKLRGIVEKDRLKGKISLRDRAAASDFTALRESTAKVQKKEQH